MIDIPKSGKTLFGSAILKSVAINAETMRRDYRVQRVNYSSIVEDFQHIHNDQDTYMELRNSLTRADILFIDSISYINPPNILISICNTRRDFRKSTILAVSLTPTQLIQTRSKDLIDIFADVNKVFSVNRK
jgi:DNA replication protein DnaC